MVERASLEVNEAEKAVLKVALNSECKLFLENISSITKKQSTVIEDEEQIASV